MTTNSGMPSPIATQAESVQDHSTYVEGFADAVTGDVDASTGHLYRIGTRITCTNSQGFSETYVYATLADAVAVFTWAERQYAEYLGDDGSQI